MRIDNGFSKKITINRVFLDQYYSSDFQISSEEFKIVYSFLNSFNINYEDDVILEIQTSSDALIAAMLEFIAYYKFKTNS
jgi:hypothetical protein